MKKIIAFFIILVITVTLFYTIDLTEPNPPKAEAMCIIPWPLPMPAWCYAVCMAYARSCVEEVKNLCFWDCVEWQNCA